ncbi:MAG: hypothetical protein MJY69_05365 [Bacteroidales bacterium]|nr:hypothetical protein [Bacteroidales bacterium]
MTKADFIKTVSDIQNNCDFELSSACLFSHEELASISDEQITDALDELSNYLFSFYNSKCRLFDEAEEIRKFDPQYALQEIPNTSIFLLFRGFLAILKELSLRHNPGRYQRMLIELFGRFTLLYAGNKELFNENNSLISTIFNDIAFNTLDLITSYTWDFDEAIYLRLTVMNLLFLRGLSCKKEISKILVFKNFDIEDVRIYNKSIILECLDLYLSFVSESDAAQHTVAVDTSWYYSYLFKKRFGFIYCRKVTPVNIPPYSYKGFVKSPCFKSLVSYEVGLGKRIQAVHLGINRRSSEYLPSESQCLYNFSTMKYE